MSNHNQTPATIVDAEKHNLTIADFSEMLRYLDAGCDPDTWDCTVAAVRRTAKGAQDGSAPADWFALLNEWRAQSGKFPRNAEVEERPNLLDTRDLSGYGLQHLLGAAMAHGYTPPPAVMTSLPAAVATALQTNKPPAPRFRPVIPDLEAPRPKWLVKNLLLEGSLAILFGRWGTGKSTVAIELCIAIALGLPWHGRKVRGGKVVYVSCENPHGVRLRLSAELQDKGITLDDLRGNFLEIAARPHLGKPEDVLALTAELQAVGPIALIVVDTLARAMAGTEENSAKDTAILVANCQTISEKTGACVMLVHHTGKDESRGMRGSSNLPASADTEIELERPSETDNVRIARVGKQRDARDYYDLFHYELAGVTLGHDEDGDPITSTVVREVAPPSEVVVTNEAPKHPVQFAVWSALDSAMRPMEVEELITTAAESLVHDPASNKRDRRREHVSRAIEKLEQGRVLLRSADGRYQIRRTETEAFERFSPVIEPAANDANADLVGGAA